MDNSSLSDAREQLVDCWYLLDSIGYTMFLLIGNDLTKDESAELEQKIYPEIAKIRERLTQMKAELITKFEGESK